MKINRLGILALAICGTALAEGRVPLSIKPLLLDAREAMSKMDNEERKVHAQLLVDYLTDIGAVKEAGWASAFTSNPDVSAKRIVVDLGRNGDLEAVEEFIKRANTGWENINRPLTSEMAAGLALAHAKKRDFAKATEALAKVTNDDLIAEDVAREQIKAGDLAGAEKTLATFIKLEEIGETYARVSWLAADNEKGARRMRDLAYLQAEKLPDPQKRSALLVTVAHAEAAAGNAEEAVRLLEANAPENSLDVYRIGIATTLVIQGSDRSLRAARTIVEGSKEYSHLISYEFQLVRALLKRKDVEGAKRVIKDIRALQAHLEANAYSELMLAEVFKEMGDDAAAIEAIKKGEQIIEKFEPAVRRGSYMDLGQAKARVLGINQAMEWARDQEEPGARASALLGVAGVMIEKGAGKKTAQ